MEEELTKKERRELAKEEKRKQRSLQETKSFARKIFLGLIVLGLIGFGVYKLVLYLKTPGPETSQPFTISDKDWVKGEKEAKTTLVEYADFECPACAAYAPFLDRLVQNFPGQLRMVYRHFPLPSHKNAMASAQVAEAAGRQGRFWEMASLLYQRQEEWSNLSNPKDKFVEYAKELGLKEENFLADYDSQAVKDKISADILSGQRIRISYTPSFFLNGRLIAPKSYEEFESFVEKEVAK